MTDPEILAQVLLLQERIDHLETEHFSERADKLRPIATHLDLTKPIAAASFAGRLTSLETATKTLQNKLADTVLALSAVLTAFPETQLTPKTERKTDA